MSMRYLINNGETISPAMSWDFDGASIYVLFFDVSGDPVSVTGMPSIYRSVYASGDLWQTVQPFANGEWRANGPISRVRVDLAGVTGYATYQVLIWRTDDPMTLIPDGAFTGLRAITTQPYTEANVKNGLQFNVRAAWPLGDTIAAGATKKLWFKTGSKPVIVKLRELQYIAEELLLRLFAGPTGVTGGTTLNPHNYNSVSPVSATSTAKKNVTTTTDGTEFETSDPEYFYGGQSSGQRNVSTALIGRERILPANTEFIVSIQNTGSGDARVQYFLDYYEGGTDLPLGA